jgi:hypothetical protein
MWPPLRGFSCQFFVGTGPFTVFSDQFTTAPFGKVPAQRRGLARAPDLLPPLEVIRGEEPGVAGWEEIFEEI